MCILYKVRFYTLLPILGTVTQNTSLQGLDVKRYGQTSAAGLSTERLISLTMKRRGNAEQFANELLLLLLQFNIFRQLIG